MSKSEAPKTFDHFRKFGSFFSENKPVPDNYAKEKLAQETSRLLLDFFQENTIGIDSTALTVVGQIHPILDEGIAYSSAQAYAYLREPSMGTTERETKLLEEICTDPNKVVEKLSDIPSFKDGREEYVKKMKDMVSKPLETTKNLTDGEIWLKNHTFGKFPDLLVGEEKRRLVSKELGAQEFAGKYIALLTNEGTAKEEALMARDLLKLLKDLCEKKDHNVEDTKNFTARLAKLKCLDESSDTNRNRNRDKDKVTFKWLGLGATPASTRFSEIIRNLDNLIVGIKERVAKKQTDTEREEQGSAYDKDDIREKLNKLFAGEILPRIPGEFLKETVLILQEDNLLALGEASGTFRVEVVGKLSETQGVVDAECIDFILGNEAVVEKEILGLESLKSAIDGFCERIVGLMIKDMELIIDKDGSLSYLDNRDYIQRLFEALDKYNNFINGLYKKISFADDSVVGRQSGPCAEGRSSQQLLESAISLLEESGNGGEANAIREMIQTNALFIAIPKVDAEVVHRAPPSSYTSIAAERSSGGFQKPPEI